MRIIKEFAEKTSLHTKNKTSTLVYINIDFFNKNYWEKGFSTYENGFNYIIIDINTLKE